MTMLCNFREKLQWNSKEILEILWVLLKSVWVGGGVVCVLEDQSGTDLILLSFHHYPSPKCGTLTGWGGLSGLIKY